MIRITVADDHPAVRAGLMAVLRSEPGLVPVAASETAGDALNAIERFAPDVALLDHALPDEDGLLLCLRLKSLASSPGVLIYSAFADPGLGLGAAVAGADAIVPKEAPPERLFHAIRLVARGERVLPPLSPRTVEAGISRLGPEDFPIFGMLLDGTPTSDIAAVLHLGHDEARRRAESVLAALISKPEGTPSP